MINTASDLQLDLMNFLTKQVNDRETYLSTVRRKSLKSQFKKIVRHMKEHDELWEYHWSADRGGRTSYEDGWCIVRNGFVAEKEIIHCS